jgi:hypothetical protein
MPPASCITPYHVGASTANLWPSILNFVYIYMRLTNNDLAIYNHMCRRGGGAHMHDEEQVFPWPVHEQQELRGLMHPKRHWWRWVLLLLDTNMQMYPSMLEKKDTSWEQADTRRGQASSLGHA